MSSWDMRLMSKTCLRTLNDRNLVRNLAREYVSAFGWPNDTVPAVPVPQQCCLAFWGPWFFILKYIIVFSFPFPSPFLLLFPCLSFFLPTLFHLYVLFSFFTFRSPVPIFSYRLFSFYFLLYEFAVLLFFLPYLSSQLHLAILLFFFNKIGASPLWDLLPHGVHLFATAGMT
jgi:hypothetical protein